MALVERRFCDGISAGEVPSDFPVAARASQVLDLGRGLTMRAQMGTPRKTLLKDAEEAADLVLLPRRGNAQNVDAGWREGRSEPPEAAPAMRAAEAQIY